jgi:O-antigen ligase
MQTLYKIGLSKGEILCVGFGVVIAMLLLSLSPLYTLLMFAGIVALVIIAVRPEIGIITIVILLSSIVFEKSLPLLPIGVGSFHVSDVILLFMVGTVIFNVFIKRSQQYVRIRLDVPLILFLGTILASTCISIIQGNYNNDLNFPIRFIRVATYYFVVTLITNMIRDEKRIRFMIRGLFAIAATVAATMLVQAMIGDSIQLMPGRIEVAQTFGQEYEAIRMLPPGQTVIFFSFITAICVVVFRENKSLLFSSHFYLVVILGIGVILTYNRHYWIGSFLAICLLMVLTGTRGKKRLLALLMTVTILSGSAVALLGGSCRKADKVFDAVSGRFISLFAGKELTESESLEDRYIENRYAIEQIEKHPILGIGIGNVYRPRVPGLKDELTYYIHNCYLWIMTDTGLLGFTFFFLFYLRFLIRAMTNWKKIKDTFFRSVVVGFIISGIVFLFMAMVTPIFMEWYSVVAISTMIGLTESIIGNCVINTKYVGNSGSTIAFDAA